jgi:hypothetical protein
MQRQGEIIKGMAKPQLGEQADVATAEVMQELLRKLHPEVLRLLRPTTDGNDEGSNQ